MSDVISTDVIIIGAGPTGLMAANQLARFGINFIIADKKSGPTIESRAIAVTARSLEIYQQLGLSETVTNNGQIVTEVNIYSDGEAKAKINIGEIGRGKSDFSYMLAYEQSKNETLLAKNIEEKGLKILWEHEFVALYEKASGVSAKLTFKDQDILINAKYLIACDGATSPVRHQLNFNFKGGTYDHKFFVADTELKWKVKNDPIIIAPGAKNFCAFLPLKEKDNYRIIGTLPIKYSDNEDIVFKDIQSTIENTLGKKIQFEKINWFSIYNLHHRMVDRFSQGRIFLAGDSAHIHSPAGGQGMNTGLQDAYNLCWKLALVMRQQANPDLLDSYNEERLPFAKWLLQFTDQAFSMMTKNSWSINLFRKYVVLNIASRVISNEFIRPFLFKVVSQTGYAYTNSSLSKHSSKQNLKFIAGSRLPYFPDASIYPMFVDACFHLIHLGESELTEKNKKKLNTLFPFPIKHLEMPIEKKWQDLGVKNELFILVRPDNYIAFIFDDIDEKLIKRYLEKSKFL